MSLQFFNWSRTASSNASADSAVNWAEGQAPSSVNDSARAMMASTAAYRDDIAGGITTGGASTAYTVTSYQVFDTLAHLHNQKIAFIAHATNTNAVGVDVTLNVDSLGAKPIRMAPGIALPNGTLVLGTPYIVSYNNTDAVFYLQNMTNPYAIPLAGGIDFWGTSTPNSSFAFPIGQALSRTTYATLFSIMSTTFGSGDGSTTFNLPDKRGRVTAALDNMGGSAASRLTSSGAGFGTAGTAMGAVGGFEGQTLSLAQLPTGITSANTGAISLSVTTSQKVVNGPNAGSAVAGGTQITAADPGSGGNLSLLASTGNIAIGSAAVTSNNTSGAQHPIVQPTILCNYILRII